MSNVKERGLKQHPPWGLLAEEEEEEKDEEKNPLPKSVIHFFLVYPPPLTWPPGGRRVRGDLFILQEMHMSYFFTGTAVNICATHQYT